MGLMAADRANEITVGKDAGENGEQEGLPVTVAGTLLDGIILALTPNSHSELFL